MGNLGFGKRGKSCIGKISLVDWSLGSFRAEQCLHNSLQSVPKQLRLSINPRYEVTTYDLGLTIFKGHMGFAGAMFISSFCFPHHVHCCR